MTDGGKGIMEVGGKMNRKGEEVEKEGKRNKKGERREKLTKG